jgi:hypothetical protein
LLILNLGHIPPSQLLTFFHVLNPWKISPLISSDTCGGDPLDEKILELRDKVIKEKMEEIEN